MSGLIAEAIHVLCDEVSNFMMSAEFSKEIIVQMHALVLACFKGMSSEADSSKEQDEIGSDPHVKTFEGTFNLPMAFVNETQAKIVTAAITPHPRAPVLEKLMDKYQTLMSKAKERQDLYWAHQRERKNDEGAKRLYEVQKPLLNELLNDLSEFVEVNSTMFPEDRAPGARSASDQYAYARACEQYANKAAEEKGTYDTATIFQQTAGDGFLRAVNSLSQWNADDERHSMVDKLGASKIQRSPKVRHIELTYSPQEKIKPEDTARVIRQYRNRSLKQQSRPLFVVVYDQNGKPSGTISLGPQFKNNLLRLMKKGAVDFKPPMSFISETAMKATEILGIPKTISVGDMTYQCMAVAGPDMALYHGPQDWLVVFTDGRTAIFPGRPTFRNMRRLNYKVPKNRFNWTNLPAEQPKAAASLQHRQRTEFESMFRRFKDFHEKVSTISREQTEPHLPILKDFIDGFTTFLKQPMNPSLFDDTNLQIETNVLRYVRDAEDAFRGMETRLNGPYPSNEWTYYFMSCVSRLQMAFNNMQSEYNFVKDPFYF